jgi:hypothetical protein
MKLSELLAKFTIVTDTGETVGWHTKDGRIHLTWYPEDVHPYRITATATDTEATLLDAVGAFRVFEADGDAQYTLIAMQEVELRESHIFGSTGLGWAVGDTVDEVMAALARQAGKTTIDANVKRAGGLYAWTCRVMRAKSEHYSIENYAPRGVPTTERTERHILNVKGKHGPCP